MPLTPARTATTAESSYRPERDHYRAYDYAKAPVLAKRAEREQQMEKLRANAEAILARNTPRKTQAA
ncbi:hypothetical protein BX589_10153 [Paraburkholderia fungorum]|jgi:hypothetical protein|uniref:hypothetical protein n=1 Tax=Paraburkholderia fungorum TaxID=134537 RepID=UPI000D0857F2|nr:hypothetical protein [Paraburkholderia fungorum]PRZ56403.1 hypothetical protein BX589_10153 [Paraburkholderia fungorum]